MARVARSFRRGAFTMIELVTVIVLIAILSLAVGAPSLAYLGTVRARSAGACLASNIRYLQRTSLNSGLRTWMVLDNSADTYRLYIENPASPGKAGRVALENALTRSTAAVQIGESPFDQVQINSISIGGGSELEFSSLGRPRDSGGVDLSSDGTISLSGGVVITVRRVTGLVERSG